jgi:PIN domain nuclease of toxin-antitoxin system
VPGTRRQGGILGADEIWVSAASIWEISTKHALGWGEMPISSAMAWQAFQDAGYGMLAIRPEHALAVERLAPIHNDPFDRMLVAQALSEPLTLVTRDTLVARYSDAIMKVE